MKVLGFCGSPRKGGNSDVMTDTFLKGAESVGAEIKKFFLAELDIRQCQGCFRNCMLGPENRCKIHRDDMDIIIPEMISADVMLFTSPLYCAIYSAIMARFLERCLPFWEVEITGEPGIPESYNILSNPVKGKKAVIGIVHDFKIPQVADLAFKAFEHNIAEIYMMNIVAKLHVTDVRDVGDINQKKEELDKIFETAKRIVAEG
ncbi:MAG: flavodoxin family protein [Candidatus Schekmanbacteria bacterium]|nr:MAG: flavodoxin family protein [Candidatus Schekmanbacteria bacterium]